ncbi:MAG: type II toxin-antitoxin system RelE/ParE family toxin [Advenella sp.]
MSRYILSSKAVLDLSDIWDYSAEQWGVVQADRYIRSIHEACQLLASGKLKGTSADFIRAGYRKQIVGMHLLFYRMTVDGVIDVVRILHQRMDVGRHL